MATEFMKTEADEGNLRQKRHLDRLSQITSYMKKHYDQPITLESVAETFGFSPNYLSRMFRLYAGISYKTYLLNLRTEYAFREMLHTDRSLNDIAINNGFPNSRAFAKSFLKRYDCLPGAYTKKIQLTASEPYGSSETDREPAPPLRSDTPGSDAALWFPPFLPVQRNFPFHLPE